MGGGGGFIRHWPRCTSREERGGRRMKLRMVGCYSSENVQGPGLPHVSPRPKVNIVEGGLELRRHSSVAGMLVLTPTLTGVGSGLWNSVGSGLWNSVGAPRKSGGTIVFAGIPAWYRL